MAKQKVSPMDYNAHKPKGKLEAVKVSGASIVEAINANPVYQPLDSDLTAIAALSTTTFGRSLLTSVDAAALATLIGAQPLDSDLTAIAALTSAADKVPYFTGSGTAALATYTAAARTFDAAATAGAQLTALGVTAAAQTVLDDTTVAAMLTTMGVTAAAQTVLDDATVGAMLTTLGGQPLDTELTALAGLTSAADKVPYFTGSGTAALADFTATGRSVVAGANAAAIRTTLGVGAVGLLETVATANIDNDGVTFAKMQNSSAASRILGRGSAAGAGDFEELTISTGLTLTGTVLTAGGGSYGGVAAWCRMNGTGTPQLTQSLGITSITDNGVGDYTLTFNYTLAHANFTVIGGALGQADGNWPTTINLSTAATPTTTTTARFVVVRGTGYVDIATLYVAIIL